MPRYLNYPERIAVEYDRNGQRAVKVFTSSTVARSFYAKKYYQGKRPKVVQPPKE